MDLAGLPMVQLPLIYITAIESYMRGQTTMTVTHARLILETSSVTSHRPKRKVC